MDLRGSTTGKSQINTPSQVQWGMSSGSSLLSWLPVNISLCVDRAVTEAVVGEPWFRLELVVFDQRDLRVVVVVGEPWYQG